MQPKPPHILLANDDLFLSARILSVLDRQGYRTDTAGTLDDVMRKVAEDRPALVILNLAASRLGGIETIRRLKAEPGAPRVLAFLSHVKIPAVREEALAAGVDKLCANSAISLRLPTLVSNLLGDDIGLAVEEE